MLVHLRRSVIVSVVFFVVRGLAYPLVETGIARVVFSRQAAGSLTRNGSTLIGQAWTGPTWFPGRPDPDNPMASAAPTSARDRRSSPRTSRADHPAAAKEQTPDHRPRHDLRQLRRPRHHPRRRLHPGHYRSQSSRAIGRTGSGSSSPHTSRGRNSASSVQSTSTSCSSTRPLRGCDGSAGPARGTSTGPRQIVTTIGEILPQDRVAVTGVVRSFEALSIGGCPACRYTLADETGEVDLMFLGRVMIAGLEPGWRCGAEGTAADRDGRLVIWNPRYRLHPAAGEYVAAGLSRPGHRAWSGQVRCWVESTRSHEADCARHRRSAGQHGVAHQRDAGYPGQPEHRADDGARAGDPGGHRRRHRRVRNRRDQCRGRLLLVYDFFFIPPYLTLWVGLPEPTGPRLASTWP